METATKKFALLSKDIPYDDNDIEKFITLAFHHGKIMTVDEYEKYHNEGKDKDEIVEEIELYDKCYEWCQHCDTEVELDTRFEIQVCPNCGELLAPCNLCGGYCPSPCPLGCRK